MRIQSGVFITGTDTGVGKTFVASKILADFRKAGWNLALMKPVQTGCVLRKGRLVAPDLQEALTACRWRVPLADQADMAPYCFKPACSPHLAARLAGRRISLAQIERAFRRLQGKYEGVIVEGAGGVLVPLNDRETMLDLMIRLNLPVVLVARPGLGTINHTLLSLHRLQGAGLKVLGVILNQTSPGCWGRIETDNVRVIERWGQVPVLSCLRYVR